MAKFQTVVNVKNLARQGVFTPDECRSLIKAAFDLMAGLKKMGVKKEDVVLFPGTSAAWIRVALNLLKKLLQLDMPYQMHCFEYSGGQFRLAAWRNKAVSPERIKKEWYNKVGTRLFPPAKVGKRLVPTAPTGQVWIVDFANEGKTFEELKTMFSDIWPSTSGQMHLIQIRTAEGEKKCYATFDIVVNDAPDNRTPNNPFLYKLVEADPYPRGCPVFGPNQLGKNMGPYWTAIANSPQYKGCERQLTLAVEHYRDNAVLNIRSEPFVQYAQQKRAMSASGPPQASGMASRPTPGRAAGSANPNTPGKGKAAARK